jgi:hypothetical protein
MRVRALPTKSRVLRSASQASSNSNQVLEETLNQKVLQGMRKPASPRLPSVSQKRKMKKGYEVGTRIRCAMESGMYKKWVGKGKW